MCKNCGNYGRPKGVVAYFINKASLTPQGKAIVKKKKDFSHIQETFCHCEHGRRLEAQHRILSTIGHPGLIGRSIFTP